MVSERVGPFRQRGAVLITSLILLMVMTVLGVTTMSIATLEERMATNSALRHRALQAAESVVPEATRATWGSITSAVCNAGGTPSSVEVDLGDSAESSADLCYLAAGEGGAITHGYSMGVGSPLGVEPHYFEVRALGRIKSGSNILSEAQLTAGVLIPPGG